MLTLLSRTNRGKSQAQATADYNDNKTIMLAMSDVPKLNNQSLIENRKDWNGWNIQITSTRINYAKKEIIHHVDSTEINPIVIKLKSIPVCNWTKLSEIVESKDGLEFVKALLGDMKASKPAIVSEYERIANRKADKIEFWTPSESDRKAYPIRAVRLFFGGDGSTLRVSCYWRVDSSDGMNCSRGVKIDSAPKEPSKVEA